MLPKLSSLLILALSSSELALPPWVDPNDIPIPEWVKSVAPRRDEVEVFSGPAASEARRGAIAGDVRLPVYGAERGTGCSGRWFLVGPLAWICSDSLIQSTDDPGLSPPSVDATGLPFSYFFVGRRGATAYLNLESASDAVSDQDFDSGMAIAITEERVKDAVRWGHIHRGAWVALRDLIPARLSLFRGFDIPAEAPVEGSGAGWVRSDRASVFAGPGGGEKVIGTRLRRTFVTWGERAENKGGAMVKVLSNDPAVRGGWMNLRDLTPVSFVEPPAEIGGKSAAERWIDVDLSTQMLVAYEGVLPRFATLISAGRAGAGRDTTTPRGGFRIWNKLESATVNNAVHEGNESRASLPGVPYVQLFDGPAAFQGVYWHDDFGRPRNQKGIHLSPADAKWLFGFTGPHLPKGWTSVRPTNLEPGTYVRIR